MAERERSPGKYITAARKHPIDPDPPQLAAAGHASPCGATFGFGPPV